MGSPRNPVVNGFLMINDLLKSLLATRASVVVESSSAIFYIAAVLRYAA